MHGWHIEEKGQSIGPLSVQELQARVYDGRLQRQTLAWHAGMNDWLPISQTAIGAQLFPQAVAPQPTAPQVAARNYTPFYDNRNTPAVVGLVCGLLGLTVFPIFGPIALIASIKGLRRSREIREDASQLHMYYCNDQRGVAIAGLILGITGTALLVLFALVLLVH